MERVRGEGKVRERRRQGRTVVEEGEESEGERSSVRTKMREMREGRE